MSFEYTIHFDDTYEKFVRAILSSELAQARSETLIYVKDKDICSDWAYDILISMSDTDRSFCFLSVAAVSCKLLTLFRLCLSSCDYRITDDDEAVVDLTVVFRSVLPIEQPDSHT